jgi:hypothetical protein
MARVEETAKLIEGCESCAEVEDLAQQSGTERICLKWRLISPS